MDILVTGGSGFLGSHVADELSNRGNRVTILDIQTSPYIRDDQNMVVGDILDQELINTLTKNKDAVYHFAGIADIDECKKRPVEAARFNILGTICLLEGCRLNGIKRFVFASSAYVYSNSGYFYRSSKQACESFIEDYHQLYDLPYTCLRYGSLYGDRADLRNSIYRIIDQALRSGQITYYGTGNEIREFIHVRDAARISADILSEEFANQHIMLTGMERYRYVELLEMVSEMIDKKIEIDIRPSDRKAHYKITPYNFSPKLGRKLTTNPHIDMGQGLLQCMAEIYEHLHKEKSLQFGLLINDTKKEL